METAQVVSPEQVPAMLKEALSLEKAANEKGETFFSSNVTLLRALDVVLNLIFTKGFDQHLLEIEKRALFTRKFCAELGFTNYAQHPSSSITALLTPDGIDGQKIRSLLEEKYKITIMGGQDQAKGKIIRIGHMGHIQWKQMDELLEKLALVLSEINPNWTPKTPMEQLKLQMKAFAPHG